MNAILKKILIGMGESAANALPGGGLAVKAAEGIVTALDTGDKVDASIQTGVAVLNVLEQVEAVDFADEPTFVAGLQLAKTGFTMMIGAVKAHQAKPKTVPTPAA